MYTVSKKGFTLVELIVVITILAILWTVAFLSLSSYTTLARNAIRLDGVSKIATSIEAKKQAGISVLSFVSPGQEVPSAQIWWRAVTPWSDYQAGEINPTALEVKSEDFSDPTSGKLFSMWATTRIWGQYEIVATIEEGATERAILSWTYEPRDSEIITWIGILSEDTFVLADLTDLNKLKKWDVITWVGVPSGTSISSVSSDGLTFTLNNIFTADSNAIQLASSETSGMVVSVDGVTPVTAGSSSIPYNIFSSSSSISTAVTSNAITCGWSPIWSTFEQDGVTYKVVENGAGENGIHNAANIAFIDNANNTNLCTSNVTDMVSLFHNQRTFDQDIWDWDTSNVADMERMFASARAFNQDIWDWDTSNVINMSFVFDDARLFNQDIWRWNTSNVATMSRMLDWASVFNQDIWAWDTANVTDMALMFQWARVFNQDISDWDTSNVTTMSSMFALAYVFNQDVSDWDTSRVLNMSSMFKSVSSFNQDISDWDTSSVQNMREMFKNASSFDQDISDWDVDEAVAFNNFDQGTSSDWINDEKPTFSP